MRGQWIGIALGVLVLVWMSWPVTRELFPPYDPRLRAHEVSGGWIPVTRSGAYFQSSLPFYPRSPAGTPVYVATNYDPQRCVPPLPGEPVTGCIFTLSPFKANCAEGVLLTRRDGHFAQYADIRGGRYSLQRALWTEHDRSYRPAPRRWVPVDMAGEADRPTYRSSVLDYLCDPTRRRELDASGVTFDAAARAIIAAN